MFQFLSAFVLVFSFAFQAAAKDIQPMFEQLKDSAENYEIVGTVCEQVARLELHQDYPESQYRIVNGIEYGDGNRTLGELDVVVIDKSTSKVELSGEVKCWRNFQGAKTKANKQRDRFINALKSGKNLFLRSKKDGNFHKSQFSNVKHFVSIAQLGGAAAAGFERDLTYTLDELMELRSQLMGCQHRGECASAQ